MGFNDWFYFEPVPMAAESRFEEVDALAKDELAETLQSKLRVQVRPGIDPASAQQASKIRVRAEDGRLVIDEQDYAAVLSGGLSQQSSAGAARSNIMSLFQPSDGVPVITRGPNGEREFAFRVVSANKLFETNQDDQAADVEKVVTDTLRTGIVDAYERAIRTVNDRYPEES